MLPTYLINIDGVDEGMSTISLVSQPAIEVDFLKFANEAKFTFASDDKQCIFGPAILADTPIYRRSPNIGEYNIIFTKDVIEQIVLKYSQQGLWNFVNLQHDEKQYVDNVIMTSMFIKNSERGIDPVEFKDVPEGSLFVEFKVTDDELWKTIKESDKISGFSIEITGNIIEEKLASETPINKTDDEAINEFVSELLK